MDTMVLIQLIPRILLLILVVLAVIWGIKSGQFRKMERASRLPLDIDEGKDENN